MPHFCTSLIGSALTVSQSQSKFDWSQARLLSSLVIICCANHPRCCLKKSNVSFHATFWSSGFPLGMPAAATHQALTPGTSMMSI